MPKNKSTLSILKLHTNLAELLLLPKGPRKVNFVRISCKTGRSQAGHIHLPRLWLIQPPAKNNGYFRKAGTSCCLFIALLRRPAGNKDNQPRWASPGKVPSMAGAGSVGKGEHVNPRHPVLQTRPPDVGRRAAPARRAREEGMRMAILLIGTAPLCRAGRR